MTAVAHEKKEPPAPRQHYASSRREVITPEMSVTWLEKNESNRNIVQSVVERYARDMRAGRWHFTGDPIQFGRSGRLLNGQHRLWACILADTAFESMVIRGLDHEDEIMDVIDTGRKRTLGDALKIHGEPDAVLLAAIVSTCWRYDNRTQIYPTHEEGLRWLGDNQDVRHAPALARRVYHSVRAQAATVGAAYYLNARVDADAAERFWNLTTTGEGLTGGDPVLAYRRWVVGAISKRDKPRPEVWLAHNLHAMNLWRAGKKVRILQRKAEEGLPEVWK